MYVFQVGQPSPVTRREEQGAIHVDTQHSIQICVSAHAATTLFAQMDCYPVSHIMGLILVVCGFVRQRSYPFTCRDTWCSLRPIVKQKLIFVEEPQKFMKNVVFVSSCACNNNNNPAQSPTSHFHFEGRFSIGLYTKFFGGVSLTLAYFPLPVNPPDELRMLHFVEYRRRGN